MGAAGRRLWESEFTAERGVARVVQCLAELHGAPRASAIG
jgi:hypothetical protein